VLFFKPAELRAQLGPLDTHDFVVHNDSEVYSILIRDSVLMGDPLYPATCVVTEDIHLLQCQSCPSCYRPIITKVYTHHFSRCDWCKCRTSLPSEVLLTSVLLRTSKYLKGDDRPLVTITYLKQRFNPKRRAWYNTVLTHGFHSPDSNPVVDISQAKKRWLNWTAACHRKNKKNRWYKRKCLLEGVPFTFTTKSARRHQDVADGVDSLGENFISYSGASILGDPFNPRSDSLRFFDKP